MSKLKRILLSLCAVAVFGVALPYAFMSIRDSGFGVLAPSGAGCHSTSDFMNSIAELLWFEFVLSSFLLLVPILVFWIVIFIVAYFAAPRIWGGTGK